MREKQKNDQTRSCMDCIHSVACYMQAAVNNMPEDGANAGDPIHGNSAGRCLAYETVDGSFAYHLGRADAVREMARDADRPCTHGEGVTVRPDGRHELSPHAYTLTQLLKNVTVEILTCETCGDVSVAWYRQENTEEI